MVRLVPARKLLDQRLGVLVHQSRKTLGFGLGRPANFGCMPAARAPSHPFSGQQPVHQLGVHISILRLPGRVLGLQSICVSRIAPPRVRDARRDQPANVDVRVPEKLTELNVPNPAALANCGIEIMAVRNGRFSG